jgi:hypothetical protein
MYEGRGQVPAQYPGQGDGDHVVPGDPSKLDDLVGNRRPESREASAVHTMPLPPHEISKGPPVEEVQFHFVVSVRPSHGLRLPPFAGKPVRRELRALIVEAFHDPKILEVYPKKQEDI